MINQWLEVAPQLGSETSITSLLTSSTGKIYGGTYPNGTLVEWNGSNLWVQVAPQFGSESFISALIEWNGEIYGCTGPNGKLLKWNGTDAWIEKASQFGSETSLYSLIIHNGEIYSGTYPNGMLLKYNGSSAWVQAAPQFGSEDRILSLKVHKGELFAGSGLGGLLLKYNDVDAWVQAAPQFGVETVIGSLEIINGKLYGGTTPNGLLLKYNDVDAWIQAAPQFGVERTLSSLLTHNGKLYCGTAENGLLLEWNGINDSIQVAPQFDNETYIRALTTLNEKLYGGTLPGGKLLEWQAPGVTITHITTHREDAKNRLLQQYKNKPNFEGLINALFGIQIQESENALHGLFGRLNIDTSVKVQLDKIGVIVGQPRYSLDDNIYRLYIKGKIGVNTSEGEIEKFISVWQLITQASIVQVLEAYPAEVDLYTDTPLDSSLVSLAFDMIKKVAAGGVAVGFTAVFFPIAFGFEDGGTGIEGFGSGLSQGTNTSTAANKLIDSGATFQTDGIDDTMVVYNTDDDTVADISSVDSETQLTLSSDIFSATPKDYYVNENVGGKLSYIQGA